MKPYPPSFYTRPTLQVAQSLLGAELWTKIDGFETAGIIVEVEAYLGARDPAAHTFKGKTSRTEAMFRVGGTCYVYFIYGMHYCVNVSTRGEGIGEGVLIRAVEPTKGIEIMQRRRGVENVLHLASGPGKLCEAFGIDRRVYGEHVSSSPHIRVSPGRAISPSGIRRTPRIGIRQARDKRWRFLLAANLFVSRRP